MGDDEGLMRPFDENHRGRPMTQQRAADRLAVEAMAEAHCITYHGGHSSGPACALGRAEVDRLFHDNLALADAIELGLLLLSDDGPKVLAEALHEPCIADVKRRWANGIPAITQHMTDAHSETARAILAALTAKLRERA